MQISFLETTINSVIVVLQLPASAQGGTGNSQMPHPPSQPSLVERQQIEAEQQRKEHEQVRLTNVTKQMISKYIMYYHV